MLRLKSRMRNRLTSGVFAVRMEHMTNRKRQKSEIPGGDKRARPVEEEEAYTPNAERRRRALSYAAWRGGASCKAAA